MATQPRTRLRSRYTAPALLVVLLLCAGRALGQAEAKDPAAILEIGGAGEWSLDDGSSSFGPSVSVEVTPIENWLELEAGFTPLFRHGQRELDTELLFKKPYTLSRKAEFMFGVGPQWARTTAGGAVSNSFSAEAALDFMFWPRPKHKFGWYLEPAYGYSFASGHEQSLGIAGGLLIAIP